MSSTQPDEMDGDTAYGFSAEDDFPVYTANCFLDATPTPGAESTLLGAADSSSPLLEVEAKQELFLPDDIQQLDSSRAAAPTKQQQGGRVRKAPDAPKRFRSSYILFYTAKQPEIKAALGDSATVAAISKRSSELWKGLSKEERAYWVTAAEKDKLRYDTEKASYAGPWKVPWKRVKKNPTAPKRPMSAFLLYSQTARSQCKAQHPEKTNTDVSRLLGERWRAMSEEDKAPFKERELKSRAKYKAEMEAWRKEQEAKEAVQQPAGQPQQQTDGDVAQATFLTDPVVSSLSPTLLTGASLPYFVQQPPGSVGPGMTPPPPQQQLWTGSTVVPSGNPILLGPTGVPLPIRLQQVPAAPPQVFDEPLEFPLDKFEKEGDEGTEEDKA